MIARRRINILLFLALFMSTSMSSIMASDPPAPPPPYPELPIDSGVIWLVIAGVVLGVYKIYSKESASIQK